MSPRTMTRPLAVVVALGLSMPGTAMAVGGDTCASATAIGAIPYMDTGDTCSGFSNWYDEHCPAHSASQEVVYSYFAPTTSA